MDDQDPVLTRRWLGRTRGMELKAAYFMKNGGPEVMEYGELADPVAVPGQVLVDVHAASVNGADWKVRAGHYSPTKKFPHIPGRDFSGVVSALGAGVTDFKVGDASSAWSGRAPTDAMQR